MNKIIDPNNEFLAHVDIKGCVLELDAGKKVYILHVYITNTNIESYIGIGPNVHDVFVLLRFH